MLLDLYLKKEITLQQVLQQLGCPESGFYQILRKYRKSPKQFTIAYARNYPQHHLPKEVDNVIREELENERGKLL